MEYKIKKYFLTSDISRIAFRSDINGLRAVAVLGVVFYHADLTLFSGGWIGVDVFFVISGFLISNIIISELNSDSFSFRNFYLRRLKRIIPAVLSTILFCLPLSYWLLTPRAMIEFSQSVTSSILFYSNYFFQNLDFYNAEPTKFMPLLHMWSLAIEEQFYLIFPFVCFFAFKIFKKNILLPLFIIFLFSIFLNSTTSEIVKFYQIQYRAWELIFGSLIMVLNRKFKLKYTNYLGFVLIIFSFVYFNDSMLTLNSLEPRLIGVIGTGLILCSNNQGIINYILNNKYVEIVGRTSFSIYLFHQPLFAFFRIFNARYEYFNRISSLAILFILLSLLSLINWRLVEAYFLKSSLKILFAFIFVSVAISFSFIYFSFGSNGFEKRFDYVPKEVLYYSNNPNIYPDEEDNEYLFKNRECNIKIISETYCKWFDNKNEKTIYLIGDSHVNALSVSFLTNLTNAQSEYNLVFLSNTTGRCLLSQQSDGVGNITPCSDKFFLEFINILDEEKDIVVVFGRINIWLSEIGKEQIKCDDCNYIEVLEDRLEIISDNSLSLIILEPIPTYNFSIADSYLYKKETWGKPITLDLNKWKDSLQDTTLFLNSLNLNNKTIISTIPIFCKIEINKCFASSNNQIYYSDTNHLTLDGANLITKTINKLLIKD